MRVKFVRLRSHDEIVNMKALYFMSPPGYSDLAPFCQESGVVALCFRNLPDLICEGQSSSKVWELEVSLKTFDASSLLHFPCWNLSVKSGDFPFGQPRCTYPAGSALHSNQTSQSASHSSSNLLNGK